jgi:hypothetical protein
MNATTNISQIPLDTITHISAVPERVTSAVPAGDMCALNASGIAGVARSERQMTTLAGIDFVRPAWWFA